MAWLRTTCCRLSGLTQRRSSSSASSTIYTQARVGKFLAHNPFHSFSDFDLWSLSRSRGFSTQIIAHQPKKLKSPLTRFTPGQRVVVLPGRFVEDQDGRIFKTPKFPTFRRSLKLTKAIEGEDCKRLPWVKPLPEGSWQTWKDTMVCFAVSLPHAIQVYALNAMDGMLYHVIDFVGFLASDACFAACNGMLYVIGVQFRKHFGRKLGSFGYVGVWFCDIRGSTGSSPTLCWVPGPPLTVEKISPRSVVVNGNIYVIGRSDHNNGYGHPRKSLFEVLNTNESHESGTGPCWRVLDNPPYQFHDDFPIAQAVMTATSDPVILYYTNHGLILCFDVNTEKWNTLEKDAPCARIFSWVVSKNEIKDGNYGVLEFDAKHGGRCFVFDGTEEVLESTVWEDVCCPCVYACYINPYDQASDARDIIHKESDDVEIPNVYKVVGLDKNALCLLQETEGVDYQSIQGFVFRIGGDIERICLVAFFNYNPLYHDTTSRCAFVCPFDLSDDNGNEAGGDARVNFGRRILKVASQPNCRFHLLNCTGVIAEGYSKMCS